MDYVICHYNEIGLKGKNRKFFEEKLVENIKRSLNPAYFEFVKRISGRILVRLASEGEKNRKNIEESLKRVFGIAYFSFGKNCQQEIVAIERGAYEMLRDEKFGSFRIATQRSKKDFPLTSQEINERVGAYILGKLKKKVDLENPDITCFIEIVENYALLYARKIKGLGGLPVGVSGRVVALLSGGIDSPVAAFYIMKRGAKLVFLHFHAYPYSSQASIQKVKKLVEVLNGFQFSSRLYLIPFGDIQKEILLKAPESLRVILYRRMMLRIAEVLAKKEKAPAILTGESLGQVASQTLENLAVIGKASSLPALRPLIGFDKEEIIRVAKEIGTFDISILPHQDCCARFLPKHPETKGKPEQIEKAEKKLNINKLIKRSIKSLTIINYGT